MSYWYIYLEVLWEFTKPWSFPAIQPPVEQEVNRESSEMKLKMKIVPYQIAAMNGIALHIGFTLLGVPNEM